MNWNCDRRWEPVHPLLYSHRSRSFPGYIVLGEELLWASLGHGQLPTPCAGH